MEVGNEITNLVDGVFSDGVKYIVLQAMNKVLEETKDKKCKTDAIKKLHNKSRKEDLIKIVNEWDKKEKNKDIVIYTEDEIRQMFDELSNELFDTNTDREELWESFKKYVEQFSKNICKEFSQGEKRILKILNSDSEKTYMSINEIKSSQEEIKNSQNKILKILSQNKDIPFLSFSRSTDAKICDYDPMTTHLINFYDCEKENIDRRINEYDDEFEFYILRFLIKNVGASAIKSVKLKSMKIWYCRKVDDDNPEDGYYYWSVVEYKSLDCESTNLILSGEDEWMNICFKPDKIEEENYINYNDFLAEYNFDRLRIELELELSGIGENAVHHEYMYYLYLGREPEPQQDENICGKYTVYSVEIGGPKDNTLGR